MMTCLKSLICVLLLVVAVHCDREKRQIGFNFGFPGFGFQQPGRETSPQQGTIDLGNVINSAIGGFLNPQNQNNQVAGAIQGINSALGGGGGCQADGTGGGCEQGCRQGARFVRCFCNAGYVLNRDRRTCSDINECRFSNAGCSQQCNNTPGSFSCGCVNGFTLLGDGRSCAPGGGANAGGGSNAGGGGVFNAGGGGVFNAGGGGGFGGFNGGFGGGNRPQRPNQGGGSAGCADNNGGCEQNCVINNRGRPRCTCNDGYARNRDRKTCRDRNECRQNNGGCAEVCTNTEGSFTCSCATPGLQLLSDGVSCGPSGGGAGTTLPGAGTSGQTFSCQFNNGGCQQVCQPTFFGIRCVCRQGFTLAQDGRQCSDVNECNFNNGGCSELCNNSEGTYTCSCPSGGTLLGDGRTCSAPQPTDPCANNNGGCEHICLSQPGGGRVCQCQPGFNLVGGNTCQLATTGPIIQPPVQPPIPIGPAPVPNNRCGDNTRKNLGATRIVGGKPADPNDWPFMAALLQVSNNNQYCGGAILTANHILTAAHCVKQFTADKILVRVGEYDFQDRSDTAQDIPVAAILSHEQYDSISQENDIAVLKLQNNINFNDVVQPVCMPPAGLDPTNLSAFVIGWGTTAFGGPVSNVLMEVQVPIWEQGQCEAAYPGKVFPNMMCAGIRKGGRDSCQGDSGGPLLTQLPGTRAWRIVGVVSWGIECAKAEKPGVYTKVSNYLDWIDQKTAI